MINLNDGAGGLREVQRDELDGFGERLLRQNNAQMRNRRMIVDVNAGILDNEGLVSADDCIVIMQVKSLQQ